MPQWTGWPSGLAGLFFESRPRSASGLPRTLTSQTKLINPITNKTSVFAVRTGKLHG
jgi:hypothetical protein